MLALQRPSMGSSKPSNRDMPFGYDFDGSSDFPYPPPPAPAPAPGPFLLDDADSKLLGDFFDGVSSDQFNGTDFFDKALNMSSGYDLPFGWTELPPSFVGTSSSFGGVQQGQQQTSHGLPDTASFPLMGNEMPPVTSADVMAAATLLEGHNHDHNGAESNGDFLPLHDISRTLQAGPSLSHQSRAPLHSNSMASFPTSRGTPTSATLPRKEEFLHNPFYTNMMVFNSLNPPPRSGKPEDIQWGSDSGFGAASFIAPPGQESQKRLERDMLKQLDCFTPKLEIPYQASSASTTQPSSPVTTRSKEDAGRNRRQSVQIIGSAQLEDDAGNKKRRKSMAVSTVKTEDDEKEEDSNTPQQKVTLPSRKRKQPTSRSITNSSSNDTSQPSPSTSKRRKSTNGGSGGNTSDSKSKSTRENLTEDQKRENHIKSEQKRRTLIKEGFDDLGELVPELGSGGFSKSAVLLMAGDWLEDLVRGNEDLRVQLAVLERRGGLG